MTSAAGATRGERVAPSAQGRKGGNRGGRGARGVGLGLALMGALAGCFTRSKAPEVAPEDARGGKAPSGFDRARACGAWSDAGGPGSHLSFPELRPEGCYVAVRYDGGRPAPDPTPEGCGYPTPGAAAQLTREAARYEAIADGHADEA